MSEHEVTPEDGFEVGDENGTINVTPDRAGLLCIGMEGVDSVSTFVGLTPDELADFARSGLALARKAGAAETPMEAAERQVLDAVAFLPRGMRVFLNAQATWTENIGIAIFPLVPATPEEEAEFYLLAREAVRRLLAARDALKAERES